MPRRKSSRVCVASSSGSPPERPARTRDRDPARRRRDLLRSRADYPPRARGTGDGGRGTGARGRGGGPRRRPLSPGRRPACAQGDRIRPRDGKTLGRGLRDAEGQIHRGSPSGTPRGAEDGGRGTGDGSCPGGHSSLVPRPSSRMSNPRYPARDRCPVLLRVRRPARERPWLLLALRHLARVRRALLSFLWSTRSRLRVTALAF